MVKGSGGQKAVLSQCPMSIHLSIQEAGLPYRSGPAIRDQLSNSPTVIPAKAGIQYAAAYRFHLDVSGILDRPPSRTMTPNMVSRSRDALRPRFASNVRPLIQRAQGMPDARCTRDLMCE